MQVKVTEKDSYATIERRALIVRRLSVWLRTAGALLALTGLLVVWLWSLNLASLLIILGVMAWSEGKEMSGWYKGFRFGEKM